jgi:hypothetical protein
MIEGVSHFIKMGGRSFSPENGSCIFLDLAYVSYDAITNGNTSFENVKYRLHVIQWVMQTHKTWFMWHWMISFNQKFMHVDCISQICILTEIKIYLKNYH